MINQSINKGIILAGGLGTRFLPWTASVSKTMLPILDKPTLHYIVEELIYSGITNILIIVGHSKDNIIKYFEYHKEDINENYKSYCKANNIEYKTASINFAIQKKLCGTANAILQGERFIKNDDFIVACGDELFFNKPSVISQMLSVYHKHLCPVIASKILTKKEATRFGVLQVSHYKSRLNVLSNIIEKPPIKEIKTPLVNLGRYILTNNIFEYIHTLKPNKNGEYALTDAITQMAEQEKVLCYNFKGTHYDIGNKVGYAKAFIDFTLSNPATKAEITNHILQKITTTL